MIPINDPGDVRLDEYRHLRDPAVRVAFEQQVGCFIAEGMTVVRRLLGSGIAVRSVLVLAGKHDQFTDLLPAGVPLFVVDRAVMRSVTGFDVHRGVLACADRPPPISVADLARRSTTLAVLEGIDHHEHLGAIARSARALGVDGLVLDPTCGDPWYRRVVRVSMGEIMFLPVARAAAWPADLAALREAGFALVALTRSPSATRLEEFAAHRPERVALLIGAEGKGLSPAALAGADEQVVIPTRPTADALDLGHAAAISFAALAAPGSPEFG